MTLNLKKNRIKKSPGKKAWKDKIRVAIVFDSLTQKGGAENVLAVMHETFPDAEVFFSYYNPELIPKILKTTPKKIHASFLQKIPKVWKLDKFMMPFLSSAYEKFDFRGFDVVITSTTRFSNHLIVPEKTKLISYFHSPPRFLWHDKDKYLENLTGVKKLFVPFAKFITPKLRVKDYLAAQRADMTLGNSNYIKKRIKKYYNLDSEVLYPMVHIDNFTFKKDKEDFYLIGGRIVSYKRFDMVIKAFNELGLKLKVFGSGPQLEYIKSININPNTEIIGRISDEYRGKLLADAKALIFPQIEDFGIVPLEAFASGTPVIALKKGGALDYVIEGETGEFFEEQTVESLIEAVKKFDSSKKIYDPEKIRLQAEKFSVPVFQRNLENYVRKILEI